jgi:hypothetical protein
MLQRSAELDGKPPMSNKNKTNHRREAPAGAVAPHEWAAIIMIQAPSSRPGEPIVVGCCIAVNGRAGGFSGVPVALDIWGFAGMSIGSRTAAISPFHPQFAVPPAGATADRRPLRPQAAAA